MRRVFLVAAAVLLLWPLAAPGATAGAPVSASSVKPPKPKTEYDTGVVATPGGFAVGTFEEKDASGVSPASDGNRPVSPTYTEASYVPTCLGNNGPQGADLLCTAALEACPAPDELRMWVWQRTVDRASGRPTTAWALADPPVRCVGPEEPAVDPLLLIAGMIRSEFETRAVVRAQAETNPAPRTLVNVPTRLETPTPESYTLEFSLLGQSVVIGVQAERWTWHTGDGQTVTTTAKGSRGRVEHTYTQAGTRAPYVVVEWSGTYSVNGQSRGPVPGRVTTEGVPGSVEVREARTELVDG